MFDAEDEVDVDDVCRDELCTVQHVHPSHIYPIEEPQKKGRPPRPWWLRTEPGAHLRQDPHGLRQALQRAFTLTDWPLAFRDVLTFVRNDYGSVSERTLHRYVRYFVDELGFVSEIDLGIAYLVYIRADSRRRHDLENLREYVLGRRAGALALETQWISRGARNGGVRHA